MIRYLTERFDNNIRAIDNWLNDFENERNGRSYGEYCVDIVGYVCITENIIITVRIFELNS